MPVNASGKQNHWYELAVKTGRVTASGDVCGECEGKWDIAIWKKGGKKEKKMRVED